MLKRIPFIWRIAVGLMLILSCMVGMVRATTLSTSSGYNCIRSLSNTLSSMQVADTWSGKTVIHRLLPRNVEWQDSSSLTDTTDYPNQFFGSVQSTSNDAPSTMFIYHQTDSGQWFNYQFKSAIDRIYFDDNIIVFEEKTKSGQSIIAIRSLPDLKLMFTLSPEQVEGRGWLISPNRHYVALYGQNYYYRPLDVVDLQTGKIRSVTDQLTLYSVYQYGDVVLWDKDDLRLLYVSGAYSTDENVSLWAYDPLTEKSTKLSTNIWQPPLRASDLKDLLIVHNRGPKHFDTSILNLSTNKETTFQTDTINPPVSVYWSDQYVVTLYRSITSRSRKDGFMTWMKRDGSGHQKLDMYEAFKNLSSTGDFGTYSVDDAGIHDNYFYFAENMVDLETGKIMTFERKKPNINRELLSPDLKSSAYFEEDLNVSQDVLVIEDTLSGQTYRHNLGLSFEYPSIVWSPDSTKLLMEAYELYGANYVFRKDGTLLRQFAVSSLAPLNTFLQASEWSNCDDYIQYKRMPDE